MPERLALIITSKEDAHADAVIDLANSQDLGHKVVRLNTEDFLGTSFSSDGDDVAIAIHDSGRTLRARDVGAVWYRRPKDVDTSGVRTEAAEFARKQATAALRGLYFGTHDSARWVNPLPALHRARVKLQQLQAARRCGLVTPRTLVTNVAVDAAAFVTAVGQVCTKSLDEPNFRLDGAHYPLLTRLVSPDEIRTHAAEIAVCPVLFQEYVPKQHDVRVIVIGTRCFAFSIHSQAHELSAEDVRGVAPEWLRHEVVRLPRDVAIALRRFVRHQGLVFAAVDFAVDEQGRYVFLENNANGQWLWLERLTGVRLSAEILAYLLPWAGSLRTRSRPPRRNRARSTDGVG